MRADPLALARRLRPALVAAFFVLGGAAAHAATEPGVAIPAVADPVLEAQVLELSHELRCLVCQNQSIAESNAPLAVDLREQVREQLAAGKNKDDVLAYLVERYGDFVLYQPPFKATTALLWGGPAVLLLAGGGWLAYRLRRRQHEAADETALTDAERARARALLAGDSPATAEQTSAEELRK